MMFFYKFYVLHKEKDLYDSIYFIELTISTEIAGTTGKKSQYEWLPKIVLSLQPATVQTHTTKR
jgi:hypothetical protein